MPHTGIWIEILAHLGVNAKGPSYPPSTLTHGVWCLHRRGGLFRQAYRDMSRTALWLPVDCSTTSSVQRIGKSRRRAASFAVVFAICCARNWRWLNATVTLSSRQCRGEAGQVGPSLQSGMQRHVKLPWLNAGDRQAIGLAIRWNMLHNGTMTEQKVVQALLFTWTRISNHYKTWRPRDGTTNWGRKWDWCGNRFNWQVSGYPHKCQGNGIRPLRARDLTIRFSIMKRRYVALGLIFLKKRSSGKQGNMLLRKYVKNPIDNKIHIAIRSLVVKFDLRSL